MQVPLIYALILAAGQSRRFGADKLMAPVHGQALLRYVLASIIQARDSGILTGGLAVLPAGNAEREGLLREFRLEYAFNLTPERGVAGSLQTGLEALASRHPGAHAALVVQGDQPRLRIEVMRDLLSAWRQDGRPVVRPRYSQSPDTPGHPVLLDRSIWGRAGELRGDAGFAPLLKRYPDLVTTVDVPGTNPDINLPSDLAMLESPSHEL